VKGIKIRIQKGKGCTEASELQTTDLYTLPQSKQRRKVRHIPRLGSSMRLVMPNGRSSCRNAMTNSAYLGENISKRVPPMPLVQCTRHQVQAWWTRAEPQVGKYLSFANLQILISERCATLPFVENQNIGHGEPSAQASKSTLIEAIVERVKV
jgi:hypothetical protein